jgi:hypothetical protein
VSSGQGSGSRTAVNLRCLVRLLRARKLPLCSRMRNAADRRDEAQHFMLYADVAGGFTPLIPSSRSLLLVSTQFLTEMSTRNPPRAKGSEARKGYNPRHL